MQRPTILSVQAGMSPLLLTSIPFQPLQMSLTGYSSSLQTSLDQIFTQLPSRPPLWPRRPRVPIKQGVEHFITTKEPLISTRAHRLPPDKLQLAKAEFDNMEAMGIICRSASPQAFPLHLAPKEVGGWQPCRDYRHLNYATVPDRYPVHHMQDFWAYLAGARIFSKTDLI